MSSFIVYRPSIGEIIVTNKREDEDITPTEQEIADWYAPKQQVEPNNENLKQE